MKQTKRKQELARQHSARQAQYQDKKNKTHQRICVWVPRDEVDSFKSAVERMRRRWRVA